MNLVTVIPIARGIGREHLTYFSKDAPEKGSLVEIPLRGRKIFGIVVSSENAEQKKSEIKSLSFGLKKIDAVKTLFFVSPLFIEAVGRIAEYYATTTGAVLSALIPKVVLDSVEDLTPHTEPHTKTQSNIQSEIVALQASTEERFGSYKSLIREEFARKSSVFICLPNREEIKLVQDTLRKGIEQYTFVLHNGLSKKECMETWKRVLEETHPVLIIGTGYFFSIPRHDIGTVIIENENSRGYIIPKRPFIDIRTCAEIFAQKMGWKIVFGDTALRVDTIYREKESEISDFSPLKFRVLSSAQQILVDMRTGKNQVKKEFEIISSELEKVITESKLGNDNLFLFCARKGLSPLTVCADCGETVSCENCNAPVVLYGKHNDKAKTMAHRDPGNFFLCHVCGKKRPADILCVRCGSWKLTTLGVGIETLEKELQKKFPESTLFVMDKDHIKTHTQAEKTVKKFYDTPGSICIGTEMALPYIKEKLGSVAVVTMDAFFNIPEFRIKEKIMNIILHLRSLAEKKIIVQTRRPQETIFDYALKGNLSDFYREEIEERKKFGYPPFNTFIKITREGLKSDVRAEMEKLKKHLLPYDLNIFEAFHARIGKNYTVHGLLIIPKGTWPDTVLAEKLRSLPPQFLVKIDPDSLL